MTTRCKDPDEAPNAHIRIHSPSPGWKEHTDKSFSVTAKCDSELAARIYADTIKHIGYTHAPLVVGLVTELVNNMPDEIRKIVAFGIMHGLGLTITPTTDDEGRTTGINVGNPRLFSSLIPEDKQPQQTRGGLILPSETDVEALKKEQS